MENSNIYNDLIGWLRGLDGWQTELAYRVMSRDLTDDDYKEVIRMLQNKTPFQDKPFPILSSVITNDVRLKSIENVEGIERLKSKKPLVFDENKNLSIVYGMNGSGKSGYVKILKQISGKPYAEKIRGNVFESMDGIGHCKINYSIAGEEKSEIWQISDSQIEGLHSISIFDSYTGLGYIRNRNSASFTPQIVLFFDIFSSAVRKIAQLLTDKKEQLKSSLPQLSSELAQTDCGKLYNSLTANTTKLEIDNLCRFSEADSKELSESEARLRTTDGRKECEVLNNRIKELDKLVKELKNVETAVSTESIAVLKRLYHNMLSKRESAVEGFRVFQASGESLKGIGTDTWIQLWNAARDFSTEYVYPKENYPFVKEGARCVLCGQILSDEAKDRMNVFEGFIKSRLEEEARKAEQLYLEQKQRIPQNVDSEALLTKAHAACLTEEESKQLLERWSSISSIINSVVDNSYAEGMGISNPNGQQDPFILLLQSLISDSENKIKQIQEDSQTQNRDMLIQRVNELQCHRFCCKNRDSIEQDVVYHKKIKKYTDDISQCGTRMISMKASEVSENVITAEYISRFNNELAALGASYLKVHLSKSIDRGVPKFSVVLSDLHEACSPDQVLSEGEARIVALASFLADVTGSDSVSTFIFDDPISSLDQVFEDKVARRLVQLSETRQVIIFTHRISLLSMLSDLSNECETICLRSEAWGSGNVGDIPLNVKDPISSLNSITNNRLPIAKKILETDGQESYYSLCKSICGDVRITVERIVEKWMLADVVQRFRRAVNTQGKIDKLTRITEDDCNMVNDFMSKYSFPEHSQPEESPQVSFTPEEIEKDISELITWAKDLKKRMN